MQQAEEGESLAVQERQLEGYAHMHGLAINRVFVERAISGSVPVTERPEGKALFAGLGKGDIVLAPKLDRLFRSALDALTVVEDLRKRGVALHLLDLGGDISSNGLSKLFLTIAAAFAEAERDRSESALARPRLITRRRAGSLAVACRLATGAPVRTTSSSSRTRPSKRLSARCVASGPRARRCGPSPAP